MSQALKQVLVGLGVAADRIEVLRNGVDLGVFRPGDRWQLRHDLRIEGLTLLSVGNLVPEKGHDLVLAALAQTVDVHLIVIGSGPDEAALRGLARHLGVESRVRWLSHVEQSELVKYYSAADATVLASSREGMPNVLLESIACGTPVIATDVGGNAEVVQAPEAGRLVKGRSAEGLAAAWEVELARCHRTGRRRERTLVGSVGRNPWQGTCRCWRQLPSNGRRQPSLDDWLSQGRREAPLAVGTQDPTGKLDRVAVPRRDPRHLQHVSSQRTRCPTPWIPRDRSQPAGPSLRAGNRNPGWASIWIGE